jgi:hypothetical protein
MHKASAELAKASHHDAHGDDGAAPPGKKKKSKAKSKAKGAAPVADRAIETPAAK